MAQLPTSFDATQYPLDEPSTSHEPASPDANAGMLDWPSASEPESTDPWKNPAPQATPTRSRHVTCHLDENKRLIIDHIPDGYTEEERDIIQHWYPELYMQPSEHARNSHGVVLTGEDVLLHAKAMFKEQEKAEAAKRKATKEVNEERQAEFASAHMEWIAACGHRKTAIIEAKKELRSRQDARKLALAEFNMQWEQYIADARNVLQAAEDVPVPPRPEKPGN